MSPALLQEKCTKDKKKKAEGMKKRTVTPFPRARREWFGRASLREVTIFDKLRRKGQKSLHACRECMYTSFLQITRQANVRFFLSFSPFLIFFVEGSDRLLSFFFLQTVCGHVEVLSPWRKLPQPFRTPPLLRSPPSSPSCFFRQDSDRLCYLTFPKFSLSFLLSFAVLEGRLNFSSPSSLRTFLSSWKTKGAKEEVDASFLLSRSLAQVFPHSVTSPRLPLVPLVPPASPPQSALSGAFSFVVVIAIFPHLSFCLPSSPSLLLPLLTSGKSLGSPERSAVFLCLPSPSTTREDFLPRFAVSSGTGMR